MKKISAVLLAVLLAASVAFGEEPPADANSSGYWMMLRQKIEKVTPKKQIVATTAVGGVRGRQQEGEELYWKGEKIVPGMKADELLAFSSAVQVAAEGRNAEAVELFENFVAAYPESIFLEDAGEALSLLLASE